MFDPSKMTILVQAAGGAGDWRLWHYLAADDTLEDVVADGFFTPFAPHIVPYSVVFVTAPGYVAQLVLLVKDNAVTTRTLCQVDVDVASSEPPHVQGVPGQVVEVLPAQPDAE